MKRTAMGLILAVAIGAAGIALWTGFERSGRRQEVPALAPTTDLGTSEGEARAPELLAPTRIDLVTTPEPEVEPPPAERATAEDPELVDAIWIEGRVLLPAGTPTDERAEIVASGRRFEKLGHHRSRVASDGSFRVAFHPLTKIGNLMLEACYLYLEPSHLDPRAPPAEVVLEPRLGAWIEGVLLMPESLRPEDRGPDEVTISLGGDGRKPLSSTAARSEQGFEFELGGAPVDAVYTLAAAPEGWLKLSERLEPLAAGEHRRLEFQLMLGARLFGRVVDEAGQAVPQASLAAMTSGRTGRNNASMSDLGASDAAGAFRVRAVAPGNVTLAARHGGYVPASIELDDVAEGEVREDLELVLARGQSVAGRVLWRDGSPAAGARVIVEEPPESGAVRWFVTKDDGSVRAAADGAFEITGLGSGPYRVIASARRDKDGKQGERWIAQADGVPPGATDLVLVLGAGTTVEGRVVNERGSPVVEFTIQMRRASDGSDDQPWSTPRTFLRSPDGAFEISGLAPGDWLVAADAPGHGRSDEARVTLPRDTEPLELVVFTGAAIAGTVLGPDGQPAAGASVSVLQKHGDRQFSWNHGVRTETDGTFALAGVTPGAVQIEVAQDGFAGAGPLELELQPGERREGVVLTLMRGGRIEGEVVTQRETSRANRSVELKPAEYDAWSSRSRKWQSTVSNAEGRFVFDAVPAGRYLVALRDTDEAEVEVQDGRTARVVLGRPSEGSIRVYGTVTRSGAGLAGISVAASGSRRSRAETDASGHYELFVDGPGEYSFAVFRGGRDGVGGIYRRHSVTAGAEQRLDFELFTGRIRGRVLAPDGSGLAGASVYASGQVGFGRADSGGDGSFEIADLPADTLTVRAQMDDFAGKPYAPATSQVDLAEGATLEGIELRLGEAGEIEGTVLTSEGQPVAGATVLVSTSHFPAGTTDGAGRFKIGGIAGGPSAIWARQGLVVTETRTVDVRTNETVQVDLVARTGTLVQVLVENASGELMVQLTDARNVPHSWFDASDPELRRLGGVPPPGARRIGPLPPGEYTLMVRDGDDSSEQTVVLAGEPFREFRVKLE